MPKKRSLLVKDLDKTYRSLKIIDGVSLSVASNQIVGLLGANGAGKSTCFNIIIGLVDADKGAVVLDGEQLSGLPMHERAKKGIGYLPQEHSVFRKLTAEENLLAVLEVSGKHSKPRQREICNDLLQEFGISRLRSKPTIQLSGGEQRRVEIARALALEPAFILLDEPFAGIDPIAVREIQQIILELKLRGIGVLITDHNVRETLVICDQAYILHLGKVLVSGTPAEILADDQAREAYLGPDFKL